MTIQNIDDVMDRIMSLNKSLSEDSLKTLLSASGWDREDIMEGLRIFRARNKNNIKGISFKSHAIDTSPETEDEVKEKEIAEEKDKAISNNPYSFSLKRKTENKEEENSSVETGASNIISTNIEADSEDKENLSHSYSLNIKKEIGDNISENSFLSSNIEEEKKINNKDKKNRSSNIAGKVLFYVLLFFVLSILSAYMFLPEFNQYVNKSFFKVKDTNRLIVENNKNSNNINTFTNNAPQNNIANENNIATSTSQNILVTNNTNNNKEVNSTDINELKKDINNLKNELEKYKNSKTEEKTIIKYLSQKGPAGKNGRGILNIDATSTGFLIKYTDNTQDIIPFSTTTIFNILNSESVCFRDIVSSSSLIKTEDICLDKNSVLNLINKN